jgi:hypothetical protein
MIRKIFQNIVTWFKIRKKLKALKDRDPFIYK